VASFVFEPTDAWTAAIGEFEPPPEISEDDMRVLDEARLVPDRFKTLLTSAALTLIAGEKSSDGRAGKRLIEAFRAERGLFDGKSFRESLSAMGLDQDALGRVLVARAAAAATARDLDDSLLSELLNEIKLAGFYPGLRERARKKAVAVGRIKAREPLHALLDWFFGEKLGRAVPGDIDTVLRDLALRDAHALHDLLARERAYDTLHG
jgi:hypothetical protein